MINRSIIFTLLFMVGCHSSPRYVKRDSGRLKKKDASGKVTNYRKSMTGISSFYAEDFHGKVTANGETYDMYGLTAAHKTLPFNTLIRVTNLDNKKSIALRVNDRGPYAKGRILDCSYGAAVKLGFVGHGTARVKIEVMELGDNQYMKRKDK
ncbi:MAG TPA: septal ring lytic transglycosylase RlpA family protein [Candidatus Marinimicrobia bacterium]|nr:septal ring lytic transglycosylase RlpA family protein [Candidatus Neomarinimicrobiota bacterium]HIB70109.1 septal ring lytic transglycosylase RlpA family protein [Candidatus Neomarinimicrobiota bacterium]HIB96244.1 septal ring lytic transglycosylase RlpA family protein [Candidatus Neomarinimicrobiota bacterium]HIC73866.1 septal ring lytic transglycosylase RlpA family protein [Candidatus Neomarinimicrobiota bacterium]HIN62832.1 septal ring lytic transglycosylase RlpA family protein [Candidat